MVDETVDVTRVMVWMNVHLLCRGSITAPTKYRLIVIHASTQITLMPLHLSLSLERVDLRPLKHEGYVCCGKIGDKERLKRENGREKKCLN